MKRLSSFVAMALAAVCASACGGDDRGRPSAVLSESPDVPPPDPCHVADGWETQSITSFEAKNPAIPEASVDIVGTTFYFNYDQALSPPTTTSYQGCTLPPVCPPGALKETNLDFAQTQIPPRPVDRCGASGSAFHYVGKDIAVCSTPEVGRPGWGGGLTVNFVNNQLLGTYDASAWDGISFWVRKGSGPSNNSLIFSAADSFTAGLEGGCSTADPTCSMDVPDTEKCDAHGLAVTLTSEWTFYAARFVNLHQKGFGKPSPHGTIDASKLKRLQFLFTSGNWDFFIDDIKFFRVPVSQ